MYSYEAEPVAMLVVAIVGAPILLWLIYWIIRVIHKAGEVGRDEIYVPCRSEDLVGQPGRVENHYHYHQVPTEQPGSRSGSGFTPRKLPPRRVMSGRHSR